MNWKHFLVLTCGILVAWAKQASTAVVTVDYPGVWQPPVLVEQPVGGVVARGQPVTLNCRASGRPPPRISWLQDGRPLDRTRPDRLTLPPGSLFFLAAKERDAGVYRCRAENRAGAADSGNATLLVATLRDTFREEPADSRVAQGGAALLKCDPPRAQPDVRVTWLKDDLPLVPGHRVRLQGSALHIFSIRPSDSGQYVCRAENVLGVRRSRPAVLTVLVQPYFVRRPESSEGLAGGSLVLPCEVAGVPRPRVHWRRLDAALPVGRLHYTEENSMRIDGLRRSDAGQYICEAENGVGRVTAIVTVTIQEAPSIDMPSETVVTVGRQMAVRCHVRGQPTPRAIWWREAEFEPLLADQERGRLSTSVQHELYIAPVTPDDLGWWVCGATNAAGSVTGRVLLTDAERPPRRRPAPAAVPRADLDRDLVHLAELQVVRPDSVRLTWKVSGRSPVDGFYICLISGASGGGGGAAGRPIRGAPVLAGRPGPVLQRVPVLNGGADSYVLTRLRAGLQYEVFLVPFRAGFEGRLSNLQHVQLPEAAPSAAPGDLDVSADGDSTVVTWSTLPDAHTNGLIRGYSLVILNSDQTLSRPRQSLLNTTSPPLRLPGRPDQFRVKVAAFTAAGIGPYSAWSRPLQGWPTDAPPPATAAVPLGGAPGGGSAPPAALVAALGALCLAALGAALLTLYCRRLRAKQERLDTAATLYADVKLPVIAHEPKPDVLTQNTLWLRDELFLKNHSTAPRPEESRSDRRHDERKNMSQTELRSEMSIGPRRDKQEAAQTELQDECHIYVNELPGKSGRNPKAGRSVRRVSSRCPGSEEVTTPSQVLTSGLESETESELERLTRRVRSLRPRAGRSLSSDATSARSAPSRISRPSLRLRRDRRSHAPHSPQFCAGAYQECCCYECDYQPTQPQPDTSCDSSSCEFSAPPGLMTRSTPMRISHFHPPHHHSDSLASSIVSRGTQSFPVCSKDGATFAATGLRPAPFADDGSSLSDSGSSLYAETELNDAPRLPEDSDVSSDAASKVTTGSESRQQKQPTNKSRLQCTSKGDCKSSGAARHSPNVPDDNVDNCNLDRTPVDGSESKPRRRRSEESTGQSRFYV